jgi:hypothetical protein
MAGMFICLTLVGCGQVLTPVSGPTFKGVVTLYEEPVVGATVKATASTCSGGPFLAEGRATTDEKGAYSLVVPMALGTSNVCIKLIAEGTVAQVSISGFAYRIEGQELVVNLDERMRIIIMRPEG